jgi:hypothetical protein
MSAEQCAAALQAGARWALRETQGAQLFIGGEMGMPIPRRLRPSPARSCPLHLNRWPGRVRGWIAQA